MKSDENVPCEFCAKPIAFAEIEKHLAECRKNSGERPSVPCEFCGVSIVLRNITSHANACKKRVKLDKVVFFIIIFFLN